MSQEKVERMINLIAQKQDDQAEVLLREILREKVSQRYQQESEG